MGALGTHVAEGLVRAGIAKLIIVDRDYIEFSNLQRQTLFTEEDALKMMPKVVAAKKHLLALRSDVDIDDHAMSIIVWKHMDRTLTLLLMQPITLKHDN
ncbi:ThiF family adenylyltransferase [Staphylococcus aureus]